MARQLIGKVGQQFGPYLLDEPLGRGGNAEVWKAHDEEGASVAVKILRNYDAASEPYRRFAREAEQLVRLGDFPGVLPILKAEVPTSPSRTARAWLAMPIAERVVDALGDAPSLAQVVDLAATVADTLARLAHRQIHHRDVKPSNLYRFRGEWVVGDFGLVKAPDVEPLTAGAAALGPRHFLAPEMLNSPATAAGEPADVYSLAKTLWVLATGQQFPPPGEHRIDTPALRLSAFVDHPEAVYLDRLIESATRIDSRLRPTMRQVADELAAWSTAPSAVHIQEDAASTARRIAEQIMTVMEPTQRTEAARMDRERLGHEALEALQAAADPTLQALLNSGLPVVRWPVEDDEFVRRVTSWAIPRLEWTGARAMAVGQEPARRSGRSAIGWGPRSMLLWTGFGLQVTNDAKAVLSAAHAIGPTIQEIFPVWKQEEAPVLLGSARQAQVVAQLGKDLYENLPEALNRLLQLLKRNR
jgi:hypothetical protein